MSLTQQAEFNESKFTSNYLVIISQLFSTCQLNDTIIIIEFRDYSNTFSPWNGAPNQLPVSKPKTITIALSTVMGRPIELHRHRARARNGK